MTQKTQNNAKNAKFGLKNAKYAKIGLKDAKLRLKTQWLLDYFTLLLYSKSIEK